MHSVGIAALILGVLTLTSTTLASSTEFGRASSRMREIHGAARLYHQNYGKYPATDENGTWSFLG